MEGAAEQRKWSEPFRAAVSKKLIPPNLILDNHVTKGKKKSHRCRCHLLLQTACGCEALSAREWMWGSTLVIFCLRNWTLFSCWQQISMEQTVGVKDILVPTDRQLLGLICNCNAITDFSHRCNLITSLTTLFHK